MAQATTISKNRTRLIGPSALLPVGLLASVILLIFVFMVSIALGAAETKVEMVIDALFRYDPTSFDHLAHPARDILVCTHGTVDAACARFGYPLYRHLRRTHASETVRVWRVSHFGGHVFAPTLMDMPSGRFWAYVEEAQADQIMRHDGAVEDLHGHYRGWAGVETGFLQAAERKMWQREGWRWFDWPRHGEIVTQDESDTPTWAEVRILFDTGDGRHSYRARVELTHTVDTIHTTGYEQTYPHPQYRVVWIERR